MNFTEADIKRIIKETLIEEREQLDERMDKAVLKGVVSILKGFGVDEDEEKETREDFRYMRRLRKASEKLTGMTMTAAVTLVVGFIGSVVYLGIKTMLGSK